MTTPLRRSRRGQPIVASQSTHKPQEASQTMVGEVMHTRALKMEDLAQDQLEMLQRREVSIEDLQTRFHGEFSRSGSVRRAVKTYGRRSRVAQAQEEKDTFRVGDTVLVDTGAKELSIAVLTGIWTIVTDDQALHTNVAMHWFLQPKELPRFRATHAHEENEIYYTLAQNVVLPVWNITGRCFVTSRVGSPPSPDGPSFCCFHAINPLKGIYYDFNWEDHRREAMSSISFWEALGQWDVTTMNTPETPQKADGIAELRVKRRDYVLEDVPEEEEESAGSDRGKAPQTPSRRKRKRATQGLTSPSKRARVVKTPDGEDDDNVFVPETPSRRGRTNAGKISSSKPSRRQTREEREESPKTDDEQPSELKAPKTPSRRKRRNATRKSAAASPDDEVSDPDYSAAAASADGAESEEENPPVLPRTPSRRQRGSTTSTPRKKRVTLAAPTPHSKAALRARAKRKRTLPVRPPGHSDADNLQFQLQNLPQDPWLRAMHLLHVSARPDAQTLPCREEEYGRVLRGVEELLEEGSGGCIYISGVPGTGKTATVHAVVRELKRMAEQNETNPFTYVEINGLRIPEPTAAYNLLWEAVSGHDASQEGHLKLSTKESLRRLTRHFGQGDRVGPGGHACVVLMDELDQLMTTKQDVVYNFFNWPTLVGSKLIVLAVANTMDLPERVMSGRVRSRLGMVRINFQPYTTPQLETIVRTRLQSAKIGLPANTPDVIASDGMKFAAMKVSSISGDARRVLDICRRAVELVHPLSRAARTDDVKRVIVDMQNSPTAAYLRDLSFHERLMLAALLRCIKREGVEEIKWGDLQRQHLLHVTVLAEEQDTTRRPTPEELGFVLDSLAASHAVLCEDGQLSSRKPEEERRIVLNLEHAEVERVLGEVGGAKWRNALNI